MRKFLRFGLPCCALMLLAGAHSVTAQAEETPSGREIVSHCEYKDPGPDQTSILSIILIDKDGNQRKNVYKRLWKFYQGDDDIFDKMVLFTQFPPDAKGTGFMRWGYVASSGKAADQWLYLPQLRKIRRVSVRDPGDSFLGSDLSYGDIDERLIDADEHKFLKIDRIAGREFYQVESVPKESNALYSKRVSWYLKTGDWETCVRAKTDYYDRQGLLLKTANLKWQQVDGAWVWDKVLVENVQTRHKSMFSVTGVDIDVGLKDRQFTERALKKGP